MYKHKACALKGDELDEDSRAGGFCVQCGQEGTIYHVKETSDYYQHILNGVLYDVFDKVEIRQDGEQVDVAEMASRVRRKQRLFDMFNERVPVWNRKEKPDEVNWTPPERAEKVVEATKEKVSESIPSSEEPSEEVPLEAPSTSPESSEESSESGPTVEPPEAISKPSDVLAELESQIAELQAKKDKLREAEE